MLADSSASGPGEIAVSRGQQVEVIEPPAASSMVMVRVLNHSGTKEEGLVPLSCLKQPVGGFKFKAPLHEGK